MTSLVPVQDQGVDTNPTDPEQHAHRGCSYPGTAGLVTHRREVFHRPLRRRAPFVQWRAAGLAREGAAPRHRRVARDMHHRPARPRPHPARVRGWVDLLTFSSGEMLYGGG